MFFRSLLNLNLALVAPAMAMGSSSTFGVNSIRLEQIQSDFFFIVIHVIFRSKCDEHGRLAMPLESKGRERERNSIRD